MATPPLLARLTTFAVVLGLWAGTLSSAAEAGAPGSFARPTAGVEAEASAAAAFWPGPAQPAAPFDTSPFSSLARSAGTSKSPVSHPLQPAAAPDARPPASGKADLRPADAAPGSRAGPKSLPVLLGDYTLPPARAGEKRQLTLEFGQRRLQLTRSQLLALPATTLTTRQAQLGRTFTYRGVLLKTLAAAMHSTGQDLRVYATNGFVATIAARDYLNAPIMLAYAADGRPISILEKGPLTIVLPSDEPRFQEKGEYWVWFVERITPVPAF